MAAILKHVKIAPTGMGLNDFVAQQEGYFAAEGLGIELDWKTFRGTQSSWNSTRRWTRSNVGASTSTSRSAVSRR